MKLTWNSFELNCSPPVLSIQNHSKWGLGRELRLKWYSRSRVLIERTSYVLYSRLTDSARPDEEAHGMS